MTENPIEDGAPTPNATTNEAPPEWPLSYQLNLPKQTAGQTSRKPWFHHGLYRGPQKRPVKILYSQTKEQSEAIARQFLEETVLGFDMEWPWDSHKRTRLQEKVALIQIACENKIALFHIAMHPGKTAGDLIAPSLRKIIESPDILKTGVAILNADFSRLVKFFSFKPRGAFELSHLHNLVEYGAAQPQLVTTKLVKLAHQVEHHLGLPLFKGQVRISDWSKPLSPQQINYGANDAYASFMLFPCMNAKRKAMDPVPPLPLAAETYLPYTMPPNKSLHLHSANAEDAMITAEEFFKEALDAAEEEDVEPTDPPLPTHLFQRLVQSRKILAGLHKVPPYVIAANSVLEDLARQRPTNEASLLQVKGVGKQKVQKYGAEWLAVIAKEETTNTLQQIQLDGNPQSLTTPRRDSKRRMIATTTGGGEQSSFSPQLQTGLLFELEGEVLADDKLVANEDNSSSDCSSAFGTPVPLPTASQLKRKRHRSPLRELDPIRGPPQSKPTRTTSFSPKSQRTLQNKIVAFGRQVTWKLKLKPQEPLVSEETAKLIVAKPPHTSEELQIIPGIMPFVRACSETKMDLLQAVKKWIPTPPGASA
ncbi:ribonuclease H-like domain-containing protein [Pseudomassariella vexata]|uniref:Ribonuclease H-like domain-containing protein n=1 Tax=Pseudomassariella vexata TaxID=1141098 RepID=A0A1Y2EBM5_9PEZI|nr:ribonuclease H-like domain-containing protein [Pseudomassariella vexata]ORY68973.1 ribonuclease H-like domain-containing protein [Pseudomassariella vexata]